MTDPEKQPHLTCQELSKQCNDADSSSSPACSSRGAGGKKTLHHLRRHPFSGPGSAHLSRKSSSEILSKILDQYAQEQFRMRQRVPTTQEVPAAANYQADFFEEQQYFDDDSDDESDDNKDNDVSIEYQDSEMGRTGSMEDGAFGWMMSNQDKEGSNTNHTDQQELLDEMENSLHSQVDEELSVFRSNLHSIISQQQEQCRQVALVQEQTLRDELASRTPASMSHDQLLSPCHEGPMLCIPESQDTWSSDLMQNSSDQQKLEAMSTSTSSLQEEENGIHFISSTGLHGPSQDDQLNVLTIQLLSSALALSLALQGRQYKT